MNAEVFEGRFEDYRTPERFDRVLVIHSHYHFDDAPLSIAAASELIEADGRMHLAAAPRGALNQLAERFWPDRPRHGLWFSESLSQLFDERRVPHTKISIEGRLDVTACLSSEADGRDLRDFIVQADTNALEPPAREHIDDALKAMGRRESDGRFTVPHPVDIYELDARASAILSGGPSAGGAPAR